MQSLLDWVVSAFLSTKLWVYRRALNVEEGVRRENQLSAQITARDLSEPEESSKEEFLIRASLQRYPRWRAGHVALGLLAYRNNDLEAAYASALAAKALANSVEVQQLIGRCYLGYRAFEKAEELFEALVSQYPNSEEYLEDLSAAQLGLNKMEVARKTLEQIPVDRRSAATVSMLDYLQEKISELN